ncbi:hypothetical protein RB195_002743 [Necator americanus]|uniref:Reverse transcriptase domain-containing protein n=1 Tax=Necator americanus TaxID=51031 RepID=A0ABR1DNA0_NECAM
MEVGHAIQEVFPFDVQHIITLVKNLKSSCPYRIKSEHLKNLPPSLIEPLARLFTHYLLECKSPKQYKTSKTVQLQKKGDQEDIDNYRPICLISVINKLFTTVRVADRKMLDEGQPCEQAGFSKGSVRLTTYAPFQNS